MARNLAPLFNPVLFPGVGELLRITQQELAYLVGLSRQRVNEALRTLQARGAIAVEYGGVRVLDLEALRTRRRGRAPGYATRPMTSRRPPAHDGGLPFAENESTKGKAMTIPCTPALVPYWLPRWPPPPRWRAPPASR